VKGLWRIRQKGLGERLQFGNRVREAGCKGRSFHLSAPVMSDFLSHFRPEIGDPCGCCTHSECIPSSSQDGRVGKQGNLKAIE